MDLCQNTYGVAPEKLNIGTAFCGYEFDGASALGASCAACKVNQQNYGPYIKPRVNRQGWTRKFDRAAGVSYLVDPGRFGFITYNDMSSTADKTSHILKQRSFGGVFLWELNADL